MVEEEKEGIFNWQGNERLKEEGSNA